MTSSRIPDCSPSRLEIEITESILLEGGEEVSRNMLRLRNRGVRLSLDDFGTGYSSLSYLSKFKFDKLKIDRSFIRELHVRQDMQAIFDAINGLAAALQMKVTVEGVEHRQQIDVLRKRFTGTIQGFYYSEPKPAREITFSRKSISLQSLPLSDGSRPSHGPVSNHIDNDSGRSAELSHVVHTCAIEQAPI